jgi:prevent-host-death family protein
MSTEFSFSDARNQLTDIANQVAFRGKRVIITRQGRKLIAIVPIEDLETLEAIEDRIDLDDARKALAHAKKHGTKSWESIKKKLDL